MGPGEVPLRGRASATVGARRYRHYRAPTNLDSTCGVTHAACEQGAVDLRVVSSWFASTSPIERSGSGELASFVLGLENPTAPLLRTFSANLSVISVGARWRACRREGGCPLCTLGRH
ncbi:hypothetical protein TRAPUB_12345 [Trametes pubescens]|uniref:Uncharacterized protein n=1 Tax=Trametes pubescens TaxID=154538 RepID=A0A1M2VU39_TRAPU|nr:hypothetical protein TRAPUB_12345 [Trametes pubescens]